MNRGVYTVTAFTVGLIFGLGLIVSGMFNPAKVLGFLDVAGRWDPSLALVMVGAVATCAAGFSAAAKRTTSFLEAPMQLPQNRDIDARLIAGSLTFGVGWGLAGFCPGPALVALGAGEAKAVVFVIAMILGMFAFEGLESRRVAKRSELSARTGLAPNVDG
jgi:uncharacterized membrane protein YedE/YeeE